MCITTIIIWNHDLNVFSRHNYSPSIVFNM